LKPRLSLARQLALEIGGLILLMLLVLAMIAYASVSVVAADEVPRILQSTVTLRAAQQGQGFSQAQASVARLKAEWLRRAEVMQTGDAEQRFSALFERWDDGVWRLRPAKVDTALAPTFYLQHGIAGPDASVQLRAVVSYELLREQGPALVPPFFSTYVDFVEKGLMVYSRGIDWGRSATPESDNHDYPTMTGSDPQRNPARRAFWTPVYHDAEAKAWMVSVIEPLDWRGRWVGTVGHDITVDSLYAAISAAAEPGSLSMIISRDGHLIAHPQLHERIAKAQGQLSLSQLGDPMVEAAYRLALDSGGDRPQVARSADGRYWIGWARIAGPDWWSVTVVPQSQIDARLRGGSYWILGVGLLCLGLMLWLLRRIIRRRVHQPLRRIASALDELSAGRDPAPIKLQAASDLARLAAAFDSMAAQIAMQRSAQQAHAAALEREVQVRTQAEAEVRELNTSLEARVQRRSAELQRTQEELVQKETLAGLGSLVAGVSHELNTPLGNALIAADTADAALAAAIAQMDSGAVRRRSLMGELERAREALALSLGNLRRSAALVRDFKQVSMDRASLQRRSFDLRTVSEEVVNLIRYTPSAKAVLVRVDLPAGIVLDSYPGPFGQVLTNLVQNALVHAFDEAATGEVSISLLAQSDTRVTLAVSDNGCGIAPALQSQVFKPFFTTRLGRGGSGLGLHIVYSTVVNVLGGSIVLRSTPGLGSSFVIELPLVVSEPGPAASSEA
jgi:signal transduction histidine kinase